ncbi:MAG TPA: GNAT family N-acetyltransferase [Steroidobacteraceae bacterium]|nr:GNAT family N-acetyltransferase [Steroidobacteraceae bacterium]
MYRPTIAPIEARPAFANPGLWLARRWYYTPRTHRAYSVRQISSGDRRLLAEFALGLVGDAYAGGSKSLRELTDMLIERVLAGGSDMAVGYAALASTGAGDRVIGASAYAPVGQDCARFSIAVAASYREEQVGRLLLTTLIRHAKRVGVQRLTGEMVWSNRPMQMLALSLGFRVEAEPDDRTVRSLVLSLK